MASRTYRTIDDIEEIVDPKTTAVLVIDMQNHYCSTKGVAAQHGRDVSNIPKLAEGIVNFLEYCREHQPEIPIFHILTYHTPWSISPVHVRVFSRDPEEQKRYLCMKNTWDAEIFEDYPGLTPLPNEYVIVKHKYSGFLGTDLELILRAQNISTVVVTGGDTNACVAGTVHDAFMRDFHVLIMEDLVGSSSPFLHSAALENMNTFYGYVIPSPLLKQVWQQQRDSK